MANGHAGTAWQIADAPPIGRYAAVPWAVTCSCAHRDDLKTPVRAHRDW